MVTQSFFDSCASGWDERHAWNERDLAVIRENLSRLELKPGMRVLDLGAGTGRLSRFITGMYPGVMCVAADISWNMLNEDTSDEVLKVHCDAHSLPFANKSFDRVIAYSCFPHFLDFGQVFCECFRVLKEAGFLLIFHSSSKDEINARHRSHQEVETHQLPDVGMVVSIAAAAGFVPLYTHDGDDSYTVLLEKRVP